MPVRLQINFIDISNDILEVRPGTGGKLKRITAVFFRDVEDRDVSTE